MSTTLRGQILQQVGRLGESQRQQQLDFPRGLTGRKGTPGRDVLHSAGDIDPADLEAMSRAIEEGCEKVDPNSW
ncbi:MAG TPA: hypothetical protein VMI06_19365 [Terriglobia bacterium]|nr:hypothetical protein [Terriglobia bacterium]